MKVWDFFFALNSPRIFFLFKIFYNNFLIFLRSQSRYSLQFLVARLFFQGHNSIPIAIGTKVALLNQEKIVLLPAGFSLLSRLGNLVDIDINLAEENSQTYLDIFSFYRKLSEPLIIGRAHHIVIEFTLFRLEIRSKL